MAGIVKTHQLEESLSLCKEEDREDGAARFPSSTEEAKVIHGGISFTNKKSPTPVAATSSSSSSSQHLDAGTCPSAWYLLSNTAAAAASAAASPQSGFAAADAARDGAAEKEQRKRRAAAVASPSPEGQKLLQVRAAARFMQGRRPQQEDRHVLLHDAAAIVEGSDRVAFQALQCDPTALIALFDGHCGSACSDFCATVLPSRAVSYLVKPLPKSKSKQLAAAAGSVLEEASGHAGAAAPSVTPAASTRQTARFSSSSASSPLPSSSSLPSPCVTAACSSAAASGASAVPPLMVRLPVTPPGPVPAFPGMSRELQQLFPSIGARLASAFRHTDRDFLGKYRAMKVGGCTAVLLLVLGPVALVASVGDSRAVAGVLLRKTKRSSKRRCLAVVTRVAGAVALDEKKAEEEHPGLPAAAAAESSLSAAAACIPSESSSTSEEASWPASAEEGAAAAAAQGAQCRNSSNGVAGDEPADETRHRDAAGAAKGPDAAADRCRAESEETTLQKRTSYADKEKETATSISVPAACRLVGDAAAGAAGSSGPNSDENALCRAGGEAAGAAAERTTPKPATDDVSSLKEEVSTGVEVDGLNEEDDKEEEEPEEQQWTALRVTRDHKPDDPEEKERIEKNGGLVLRVGGVARVAPKDYEDRAKRHKREQCLHGSATQPPPVLLAVSRGMGDRELKEERLLTATPDVAALPLTGEIRMFVVACDGVWDVLTDEEVVKIASQHLHDPQEAASQVVKRAFQLGSQDNLTSIVVVFDYEEEQQRHTN